MLTQLPLRIFKIYTFLTLTGEYGILLFSFIFNDGLESIFSKFLLLYGCLYKLFAYFLFYCLVLTFLHSDSSEFIVS